MKRPFLQIYRITLAIVLALCSSVYLYANYENEQFHVLIGNHKYQELRPVGELIKDIRINQSVDKGLIRQVGKQWVDSSLCIEVLLANYCNRTNMGVVYFGVALDDLVEYLPVAAESVQDNTYHRVCFKNFSIGDLYAANQIQILIEGVDSQPGKAVTAWSTSDVSFGRCNTIDEHLTDRSLVFRLGYTSESQKRKRDSLILTIFGCIAIYILIVQPYERDPN